MNFVFPDCFEYGRWISAGINSWRQQGLRAHAMSTTTQGHFALSRGILNGKNEPDHLLVLVHGILARFVLIFHLLVVSV